MCGWPLFCLSVFSSVDLGVASTFLAIVNTCVQMSVWVLVFV